MPGHERRDIDIRLTVRVVAGLLFGVVVVAALMAGLLAVLGGPVRWPAQLPPTTLRTEPLDEPGTYAREKEPLLRRWEWADPQRRTARIPVEEAMGNVVRRGWR